MKKIALVAVAAGLMSVTACNKTPTEAAADNVSDNMEAQADNLGAMADNATGADAAALTNASENMEDQADAVENSVENSSL
jgi:cytochrome c556